MNPNDQRIAIALSVGWKRNVGPDGYEEWLNPRGENWQQVMFSPFLNSDAENIIPDYLNNRDDIHEAISIKISQEDWPNRVAFLNTLRKIAERREGIKVNFHKEPLVSDYDLVVSTAAELSEAYLKVFKLWVQ